MIRIVPCPGTKPIEWRLEKRSPIVNPTVKSVGLASIFYRHYLHNIC